MNTIEKEVSKANNMLLEVENKIREGLFEEATHLLAQIKEIYPEFGPAYNHTGWLFAYHLGEYDRAESEYKNALKIDKTYPDTYFNYASLLCNLQKYKEAETILKKATNTPSVNKSKAFRELGCVFEMQANFEEALEQYKKAVLYSFHYTELEESEVSFKRCKIKQDLLYS